MRTATKTAAGGLALAGGIILLRSGVRTPRQARHQVDVAARHLRHLGGRLHGVSYKMRGGHPDPDVGDTVLADRVRSTLGPLERRLDVPRVHVMVEDHVVLLHGCVGTHAEAAEIEQATAEVSGVSGVESYLHVGLAPNDTRPSAGRAVHPASEAMRSLLAAAEAAGLDEAVARPVVRGVLATFADRLPAGEREQVAAHLPADVRAMFTPPRRMWSVAPARTSAALVARILAETAELPPERAQEASTSIIRALRSIVPDEAADVAAVLPTELRSLWELPPAS